ncbi:MULTISPECIES: hypothetical protein [unclassified Rhizobium]|uniref:hypothetical protein n=1 Tax=unclassified Rhizobium TaxID=2613769 RepID=UPI00116034EB|nr:MULTISPECIES: hypothetical protein [unclassified Rhizobium]MBO9101610.1 hypothetical protein [Rhizobium sp. L58/93]MBO9134729.1 hypothetical protein [Rhizobium sp. B209b/85]MBO9170590.1 hypothetical protein [Rhizobium sp. L245/93]MBO9187603.1 hypothetical protein [Rhizobium sp. E27B/91]QXZ86616.1 hypothetical protein J5287_26785 [Rhizobium sp. K1/93]
MSMRLYRYAVMIASLVFPGLAAAETQWTAQLNQWSVGFDAGTDAPYCRLLWDSHLGKTVEFRASRDTTRWLVSRDGWSIPAGTKTTVTIVDGTRRIVAPAAFFDARTLQVWTKDGKTSDGPIRRLVTDAFQGRPDVQLTFSGNEPDWTVPMSRVQTLYPEFVQCMGRLSGQTPQTAETASAQPF